MRSHNTISLYWKCQIIGWSISALYWEYLAYSGPGFDLFLGLLHFVTDVLICISVTHVFKLVSKKYGWQELPFQNLLIRIIPSMLLLTFVYTQLAIIKLYTIHSIFRVDFTQSFSDYFQEHNVTIFIGGI